MICGHNHETLRWALTLDAQVEAGHVVFSGGASRAGKHSRNAAYDDIHDPAKLAAIIADLLRERGVEVHEHRFGAECPDGSDSCDAFVQMYPHDGHIILDMGLGDDNFCHSLTMPQARTFALALLDAPNASAQDVERMIGAL